MLAVGRVGANVHNSALQAAVRTSPFQQAGMLAPAGDHPGQLPNVACSLMGHLKGQCWHVISGIFPQIDTVFLGAPTTIFRRFTMAYNARA